MAPAHAASAPGSRERGGAGGMKKKSAKGKRGRGGGSDRVLTAYCFMQNGGVRTGTANPFEFSRWRKKLRVDRFMKN